MKTLILIAIGGAIGAVSRHAVSASMLRLFGPNFPVGTMVLNILGSFIMGCLAAYFMNAAGISQSIKVFLTVGVLGAFTTFSAFSLDTLTLFQRGEVTLAFGYVLGSVILSIGALWGGFMLLKGGALT